ncbi:hypothetical protein HK102_001184 [Quaeritorhiza haematococci]|nr:hypothetical protein HK102_001184 [Quaeritorhiza haematococci]
MKREEDGRSDGEEEEEEDGDDEDETSDEESCDEGDEPILAAAVDSELEDSELEDEGDKGGSDPALSAVVGEDGEGDGDDGVDQTTPLFDTPLLRRMLDTLYRPMLPLPRRKSNPSTTPQLPSSGYFGSSSSTPGIHQQVLCQLHPSSRRPAILVLHLQHLPHWYSSTGPVIHV